MVLVRAMSVGLYAEYCALGAMVGLATFLFEAGANSGLTRYLREAQGCGARERFYRRLLRGRVVAGVLCAGALWVLGPLYGGQTGMEALQGRGWMYAGIGLVAAGTLGRLLGHYGLMALFDVRRGLMLQQGFAVGRALVAAGLAWTGFGLEAVVGCWAVLVWVEAFCVHRCFLARVAGEDGPLPEGLLGRARVYGWMTILDKAGAMLGGGTVLLLVAAVRHEAASVAVLGLAFDLVGKCLGLTVLPMGNLVGPYLSRVGDGAEAQAEAAERVFKLSALLYACCISAAAVLLGHLVPVVYGGRYGAAAHWAVVLLVPSAVENWMRGCASPVLLRNGRYRMLGGLNVLQVAGSVLVLALCWRGSLQTLLLGVCWVRALLALCSLVFLRDLLSRASVGFAARAVALGGGAWGAGHLLGGWAGFGAGMSAVLGFVGWMVVFACGGCWLLSRDRDLGAFVTRFLGDGTAWPARLFVRRDGVEQLER